jgi:hypothetical protein
VSTLPLDAVLVRLHVRVAVMKSALRWATTPLVYALQIVGLAICLVGQGIGWIGQAIHDVLL